ncbi:15 kDa selenoprotein [Heterocephalus glaber]|uniref:Selenoprotein F n=1 Tax=Heterocephalus glaber TaxID=10181 RepID=G5BEK7_HETGA|nr:15 kDa selenoprotein [Heterocephalus glaber]
MAAGSGAWFGPAFGLRLLLASVLHAVSAFKAEFSSEACTELGFSSNLLCSSCDLLGQFNLLQLDPDCRGCCQEEAQFETKKYVRGSDPVLKLLDDNGNIAEELSILKWNTDSVEEFLSEKLERI